MRFPSKRSIKFQCVAHGPTEPGVSEFRHEVVEATEPTEAAIVFAVNNFSHAPEAWEGIEKLPVLVRYGTSEYTVNLTPNHVVRLEPEDEKEDEEDDTPCDKILLTFPVYPEDPESNRAPDGWIEIQRDDSPDAPEGETWHPLASDDEAALAVCPDTACLYHCETGAMALLSDDEACKALPEGPAICIVPRAIARVRYAEVGITIA